MTIIKEGAGARGALWSARIAPAMADGVMAGAGAAAVEPPIGDAGPEEPKDAPGAGAGGSCSSCGTGARMTPIYAIGTVAAIAPSMGVQRELDFEISLLEESPETSDDAISLALKKNPHLARMMCWVLKAQGVEVYHLAPRSDRELGLLVDSLREWDDPSSPLDTEVIIGWKGPVRECASLSLPSAYVENVYSYGFTEFIKVMGASLGVGQKDEGKFKKTSRDFLDRVQQIADNMGDLAEHRALNYLAVRYPHLYALVARQSAEGRMLAEISCKPSRLSSVNQEIKDVILTFQPVKPGIIEQWFVRVNVTDIYPFALTGELQPYYER